MKFGISHGGSFRQGKRRSFVPGQHPKALELRQTRMSTMTSAGKSLVTAASSILGQAGQHTLAPVITSGPSGR